ncbi:unnamed protein product, partial [Ilex paraguariensis]
KYPNKDFDFAPPLDKEKENSTIDKEAKVPTSIISGLESPVVDGVEASKAQAPGLVLSEAKVRVSEVILPPADPIEVDTLASASSEIPSNLPIVSSKLPGTPSDISANSFGLHEAEPSL